MMVGEEIQARIIKKGMAEGDLLVSHEPVGFFGNIDPDTGIVIEKGHDLEGECIAGKILVFPTGKGSTVGSYTIYRLMKSGKAPLAIINEESEPITAVGAIISNIPMVDKVDMALFKTGGRVRVNANDGTVVIL